MKVLAESEDEDKIEEFEYCSSNDTEKEDSNKEDDNGLHNVCYRFMLARDDMNDLFGRTTRAMVPKRRIKTKRTTMA